jgi:hypothetical protein
MVASAAVGRLEVQVPGPEDEVRAQVRRAFPHSDDAWRKSAFGKKLKGRVSANLVVAYSDIDGSILVVHSQGELAGKTQSTLLDIRIEPAASVSTKSAIESVWHQLRRSNALAGPRGLPRLERAVVGSFPGRDILEGQQSQMRNLIVGRSEFNMPVLIAVLAVVTFLSTLSLIPVAQRASGWWTLIQLVVPGLAAIGLAWLVRRKRQIDWTIK